MLPIYVRWLQKAALSSGWHAMFSLVSALLDLFSLLHIDVFQIIIIIKTSSSGPS